MCFCIYSPIESHIFPYIPMYSHIFPYIPIYSHTFSTRSKRSKLKRKRNFNKDIWKRFTSRKTVNILLYLIRMQTNTNKTVLLLYIYTCFPLCILKHLLMLWWHAWVVFVLSTCFGFTIVRAGMLLKHMLWAHTLFII